MAAWTGVVTDAGAALLAQWAYGGELTLTAASAGSGTVDAESLRQQTELTSPRQKASIVNKEAVEGGIRLQLQVTAAQEGYRLQQYGVFARLDAGEPVLAALFQRDDEGVPIPGEEESPDFVFTFYALLACSNLGAWTAVLDTSALVSHADLESRAAEAERKADARMDGIDAALASGLEGLQEELLAMQEQLEETIGSELTPLTGRMTEAEAKIATLWDAVFTNITGNPFTVVLSSLDGLTVTAGVWNAAQSRLEC